MTDENAMEELLNFFKALADANRLKIVGLLAQESLSVEQLAEMLKLHPSTVSHHLSRLTKAGLVSARAEGYYSVYQLETKALEDMARRLLEQDTLPGVSAQVDMDAYDSKVIKTFMTPEGRLKDFPAQQKKLEAILRYVVKAFEPGKRYTEKEVNEILSQYSHDYARLRRNLVEVRLMARAGGGGEYWRIDEAMAK
jgi:DNA-binding transcriptional ArsR family regulator